MFFLILLVATKSQAKPTLVMAAALALGAAVVGLAIGGPLALLLVGAIGLHGWTAALAGATVGGPLGLLELALFVRRSRGQQSFRKLAPVFGSVGAWSGGLVGYFAG